MASYSTIPATEDLGLTAAAPPKNTLGRQGLATLVAICGLSALAGTAAPSAARGLAGFAASSSSSQYQQIRLPVKGDKWLKERTEMKYGKDPNCLAVADHNHVSKGSLLEVWPCKKGDPTQEFLYVPEANDNMGQIKWLNPNTGHHMCLDLSGGEDATTGSPIRLNSCKDGDDNQSFLWDETYNTFTIPMDPSGDDDRLGDLCMGTKRKYGEKLDAGGRGKFLVVGVNCDGDSEVEGDVFWTMPPDYRLSY